MNKTYKALTFAVVLLTAASCSKNADVNQNVDQELTTLDVTPTGRNCGSMEVLAANIKENPQLLLQMNAIEEQTSRFLSGKKDLKTGIKATPFTGTVEIPVYVHVIYNKAIENISTAQIQSQIDVLNKDFSATNADVNQTPGVFSSTVSNMNIHYTLAGVDRTASKKTSWGTRDAMKSSKRGGVDAIDPAHNLNIWVCNIGGGILGYAQFPGGNASTDGVVIGPNYFGNAGYVSAPYDKGRTATHEIGHWLNLRHIWGDGGCGVDDYVADTPGSDSPNYGCPAFPTVKCSQTNMTMNYMDYTDDPCMYMFTNGQKDRTRAIFASDGARFSFVQ
ncbi:MAG: zinc metalloprotease [Daejeonella sp.]